MSLRERFRLEEIENEKLKQNRNFPMKETVEAEDLGLGDALEAGHETSGKKEKVKDINL